MEMPLRPPLGPKPSPESFSTTRLYFGFRGSEESAMLGARSNEGFWKIIRRNAMSANDGDRPPPGLFRASCYFFKPRSHSTGGSAYGRNFSSFPWSSV